MSAKGEVVRIEYSLPADIRSPVASWQQNETTQYPEDRAHWSRINRAEMIAKSRAGLITRRRAR